MTVAIFVEWNPVLVTSVILRLIGSVKVKRWNV